MAQNAQASLYALNNCALQGDRLGEVRAALSTKTCKGCQKGCKLQRTRQPQRCKKNQGIKSHARRRDLRSCPANLGPRRRLASACATCVTALQRRRLSEDATFATFDDVQDYVDLACVIVIVAVPLCSGLTMGVTSQNLLSYESW